MDPSLSEFVDEAQNILKDLEESIRSLRDLNPDDHRKPDTLNALYRQAHSLKGLSSMFNLERISGLSHRMEDFLDGMRLGRISLSGECLGLLGKGRKILMDMIRSINEGRMAEPPDYASFIEDLEDLERGGEDWCGEGLSSFIQVSEEITGVLSKYEEHRFWDNVRKGVPLFKVACCFPLGTFDGELRHMGSSIREIGELLTTMPRVSLVEGSNIGFILYFASKEKEGLIRKKMGIFKDGLEKIPYRQGPCTGAQFSRESS